MSDNKNSLKLPVAASIAILLLIVTSWLGRSAYLHFKERHSLTQAQAFLVHGDYRNSLLSVRQTLQLNPSNASACRIMANLVYRIHPQFWIGDGELLKLNHHRKQIAFGFRRFALSKPAVSINNGNPRRYAGIGHKLGDVSGRCHRTGFADE